MSKIAIEGNASGTGTITITGTNTNTDYTITVPGETGTLLTTGASGVVTASMLASGAAATNLGNYVSTVNGSTGAVTVQATLVSGSNIKTVNSTSLLGAGDVAVQPTLVSGSNIKTINGTTLLGSGDLTVGASTTLGAIGTYIIAVYAITIPNGIQVRNADLTVAGSSLRYNFTPRFTPGAFGNLFVENTSGSSYPTSPYGGGTSLSGTWRLMGRYYDYYNLSCTTGNWYSGLWVRIS